MLARRREQRERAEREKLRPEFRAAVLRAMGPPPEGRGLRASATVCGGFVLPRRGTPAVMHTMLRSAGDARRLALGLPRVAEIVGPYGGTRATRRRPGAHRAVPLRRS
ncbi:MAG: hypothetical protein QXG65_04725 [Thermoplasmata archaeon]